MTFPNADTDTWEDEVSKALKWASQDSNTCSIFLGSGLGTPAFQ